MATPEALGFLSIDELRDRARTASFEQFAAVCKAPFIELVPADPTGQFVRKIQGTDDPAVRATRSTVAVPGGGSGSYQGRAALLVKRPFTNFPDIVSLGRSMTCDIVIILDTVSKVHGFFVEENGRWAYSDNKSTNGTILNGDAVKPREKRPLADGDQLRFGHELIGVFHTPRAFHDRVRRL